MAGQRRLGPSTGWLTVATAKLLHGKVRRVYGMTMTLTHAEVDDLYSEPTVKAYRLEPVLARLADGTAKPALCFNLLTAPEETAGNPEYAAALQAVVRKLGLPIARQSGWEARDNQDGESVSRRYDDCRDDCRAQEFF